MYAINLYEGITNPNFSFKMPFFMQLCLSLEGVTGVDIGSSTSMGLRNGGWYSFLRNILGKHIDAINHKYLNEKPCLETPQY